jgi:hypothetical protein
MHGNTCVVRIGGGFEPLLNYTIRTQEQHRRAIKKIMEKDQKSYEKTVEDQINKYYRSKPKTTNVMNKMKWFIARQGYFHYGQQIPEIPNSE